MGKFYRALDESLRQFIAQQHMFFVATAAAAGRINLSPKGIDSFRVLSDQLVGYLDLTGSGNETAAHICHDGRMTIMFCSFSEDPLILRLYGRGRIVGADDPQWGELFPKFPALPGTRQLILLQIESVGTSCGFGVPVYELRQERPTMLEWATKLGEPKLAEYRRKHNRVSIDGLEISRP
jgi:hypothetical protein